MGKGRLQNYEVLQQPLDFISKQSSAFRKGGFRHLEPLCRFLLIPGNSVTGGIHHGKVVHRLRIAFVGGTPFDFRTPTRIGERIEAGNEQLKRGCGYDHNWVLNKKVSGKVEPAAVLSDPNSGRKLKVLTDQPGLQFFAGGTFASRENGKNGLPYKRFAGIALETQNFPDAPNKPNFPPSVLRAGGEYNHVCIYKFGVDK